jgi:protein gp37
MSKTTIEWATHSINFYNWQCHKVSEGCANCYMMAMAKRFPNNGAGTGVPQWRNRANNELRNLPAGSVAFINSMSDSYHESVPQEWIHRIHNAAWMRPDVTFLMLTKRPHRAYGLRHFLKWPENLWIGTSVESPKYYYRLDFLLRIPAAGHFLSAEPLLEGLPDLGKYLLPTESRAGLKWVIVGGESGDNRREFNKDWARQIRNLCHQTNVPFMFKQGSHRLSGNDRLLDSKTYDESPFLVHAR